MSDKSELLDQLSIDRSAPAPGGWSPWAALLLAAVTAVAGGFIALKFFAPEAAPVVAAPAQSDSRPAATTQNGAAAVAEPEPSPVSEDERILNASGYITARRIATVSAEITGRIVEVNVEEGMEVTEGQVLARLDDAVAAWLLLDGVTASTLGGSFSQVVFNFKLSPELFKQGIIMALVIGLVGGFFPAFRAARLPVLMAFRDAA